MKVEVLDIVEFDLATGADFYERQQQGLGDEFRESVLAEFARLQYTGGIHSKTFGYHHCSTTRFPFIIYYSVKDDTVLITTLMDGRTDPATIKNRLQS